MVDSVSNNRHNVQGAHQQAQNSGDSTVGVGEDQNNDADTTDAESGALTKKSRALALLSIATKMADAQTARNAKQADAMNQI